MTAAILVGAVVAGSLGALMLGALMAVVVVACMEADERYRRDRVGLRGRGVCIR
jgi:hypothetical protein